MPLQIACKPEFADYLEAQLFHDRRRRLLVSVALLLLGAAFALLGHGWWWLVLMAAYALVVRPLVVRKSVRRAWERSGAGARAGGIVEFDDGGMHMLDESGGRDTTPWSCFRRLHESPGLFLVYLSPRVYLYFPKRTLRTPEQNELRKILREHIGPRLPDGGMF